MIQRLPSLVVVYLAACGGKQSPPPPPVQNVTTAPPVDAAPAQTEGQIAIAKMQQFTDQMCTCVEKACADKVQEDMTIWASQMANKPQNEPQQKPTDDEMKTMTDIGERYGQCMMKAMEAKP